MLAQSLDATVNDDAAAKLVKVVSTTLGARGLSRPDNAIQALPSVLIDLASLHGGRVRVADELVALASFSDARPGTLRAAYSVASLAVAGSTAVSALEAPMHVQSPPAVAGTGSNKDAAAGALSWSEQPTAITVVQYSGSRNPYWPSPDSSTDVISIVIAPLSSAGTGAGGGEQARRRLAVGNQTASVRPPSPFSLVFSVKSRLFGDGTRDVVHEPIAYDSQDACGGNTTHKTGTVFVPTTGKRLWCAVWDGRAGPSGEWNSDPCHVLNTTTSGAAANTAIWTNGSNGNILRSTLVWCECVIKLPPQKKGDEASQAGVDVALSMVDFSFTRVAQSFAVETPLHVSTSAILLCIVPSMMYALVCAYLFQRRHRAIKLQEKEKGSKTSRRRLQDAFHRSMKIPDVVSRGDSGASICLDNAWLDSVGDGSGSPGESAPSTDRTESGGGAEDGRVIVIDEEKSFQIPTPSAQEKEMSRLATHGSSAGFASRLASHGSSAGFASRLAPHGSSAGSASRRRGGKKRRASVTLGVTALHKTIQFGLGVSRIPSRKSTMGSVRSSSRERSKSGERSTSGEEERKDSGASSRAGSRSSDRKDGDRESSGDETTPPRAISFVDMVQSGVRSVGNATNEVGRSTGQLWWQGMKRHHDALAPIFAPDIDNETGQTRMYYMAIFLLKYAVSVASATTLYHL